MKKILDILLTFLLFTCLFACSSNDKLQEKNRYTFKLYIYNQYEYPVAFGEPEHTLKQINNIKKEDSRSLIHTYIDYLLYCKNNIAREEVIDRAMEYLYSRYDEVGKVTVFLKDKDVNLLYIKNNNHYYVANILAQYDGNYEWLPDYPSDLLVFDSIKDMREKLDHFYEDLIVSQTAINNFDDIKNIKYSNYKNAKIFNYCGVDAFYDLGMPKLTLNEIRYLMGADKDKAAKTITTLADALAYVVLSGFRYQDNTGFTFGEIEMADVGNIHYPNDSWVYSASGRELLDLKLGQCTAMSTLFNYLLYGDYKEVGYVLTTGHAMLYVIDNNDTYYLLNPANYLSGNGVQMYTSLNEPSCRQMDITSKDPNKLFNDLMKDFGSNFAYTFSYDGVFCNTEHNSKGFDDPNAIRVFPEGAKVACYAGNPNFGQAVPPHSTSQENILGLKFD